MEPRRSLWGPSRPVASTGRPAQHSRADFVASAVEIAEQDGLEAVTMRRLADTLGTGAASAYRHLGSRDDLVDLMIDHVLADYRPPEPTGAQVDDVVIEFVHRLRFTRAHPWLIDALDHSQSLSPQRIRLIEISLARLASHPATGPRKIESLTVLAGLLSIQARYERAGQTLAPEVAEAQVRLLHQAAEDGDHPHLAAALSQPPTAPGEPADERFARVVRGVLEGLLSAY